MVEGLKFQMTSEELRDHLIARVKHHVSRREFYTTKADELERGKAEGMGYSNGDPVRSLREKCDEHDRQVKLFTWMHDHVAPDESYQLDDKDLQRLEILGRGW